MHMFLLILLGLVLKEIGITLRVKENAFNFTYFVVQNIVLILVEFSSRSHQYYPEENNSQHNLTFLQKKNLLNSLVVRSS